MQIWLTLGIVVFALVCFVAEWLPADITAITIAVILMLPGLINPDWSLITVEEGISGFSNSATVTIIAMFILSEGIAKTGAIGILRDLLIRWGGKNSTQQIFLLGAIVGPVTAFINNTAVVAVFIPIVEDWCKKQNISVSKLLIPLSHVTVLGGMLTLIGTSTNLLASGVSKDLGYGEFGLFQFTQLGLITFIIGLIYISFAAPKLLPARRKPASKLFNGEYNLKSYISEVVIKPSSSLAGKTLAFTQLQRKFDLDVLEIVRNDVRFSQPLADKVLNVGDILIVRGTREELLKIRDEKGIDIVPDIQFEDEPLEADLSSGEEGIAEVLILDNSELIGSTLKDVRFRQRYNATVLAIRRGGELLKPRLGRIPLKFGDLLLVQGPKQSIVGLQTEEGVLVIEQKDVENTRKDKAIIAVGIILGVIIAAAFEWIPILIGALAGVVLMILTGCLKPGEIYGAVRWDVIFLLAGLIPLGAAMKNSGATEFLANGLVNLGVSLHLSGYWILVACYLATALLTEILSNNATVVLMLPLAAEIAKSLDLNPFAFMFAVTFASSNSFMTPIGYQTNTMVYGPGGYKFLDFTRLGAPLTFIFTFLTPLLITWIYGLK
jgi:di/tricarboxylate transporter